MLWFKKNKIEKDMIQMIRPTSKSSLKTQCLLIANGDIEKAEKLYDFYAKDMPDMPLYDAPSPTWVDNTKDTLNGFFSFLGEHKEGLSQGYEMLRMMFNARGANLPPLGGAVEDVVGTSVAAEPQLPPINE